jgi:hypothetical protein
MQSKEKVMTPEQTLDWLAEQHKSQCNEDRPVQEWIRSMKSMLPAPVQEPVAWEIRQGKTDRVLLEITNNPQRAHDWKCSLGEVVPLYAAPHVLQREWTGLTDEERDAIFELHHTRLGGWDHGGDEVMYDNHFEDAVAAIEAKLKAAAAPAQPAPANLWLYWKVDDKSVVTGPFKTHLKDEAYGFDCIDQTPLTVAAPPAAQRQWVGLTQQERKDIWREAIGWGDPSHDDIGLMIAIETKLKEKNT